MPLLIPELRLDIICFSHFSHLLMIIPQVRNRVAIPDEMIPADAHVEIDAKMYAGEEKSPPLFPTLLIHLGS